ncbi:PilN domain-containing protein [bacterium]|nr:PilN domain-containing protein [bacterium]
MAIKVDLLPTERKKFGFDIVIALMILLIAGSAVGCVWWGQQLEEKANKKQDEVKALQAQLKTAEEGLGNIAGLRKKVSDLKANINTVKTLKLDPVRYSNLLDELSSLLPNNMWVSSISVDTQKHTLTMSGLAAEQPGVRPVESISGFMKSVGKSKYFKNATISSTTRGSITVAKNTYTSYSFNIELEYDPDKAIGNAI